MIKFLKTEGISHYLREIIDKASKELILISPYLKINDKIKQSLEDKDRLKIDIRIVYGKNELQYDQKAWIESMKYIRLGFCKNLHAKCYLSEKEAIITSMNLYDFSQINNEEMGIYINKNDDPQLYEEIYTEARRLIRISEDSNLPQNDKNIRHHNTEKPKYQDNKTKVKPHYGYCIRTGVEIPFNPERPLCYDAYRVWSEFENYEYPENFCHFSGEPSHGETSVGYPILRKNWRKARKEFGI